MVRTIDQLAASSTTTTIRGGYASMPVASLLAVWFASQGPDLGTGEFRAWLACIEMVERRGFARHGAQPAYGFDELAKLLGVTRPRARLLVRDLVAAGLLTWSQSAISFPPPPPLPDDLLGPFADTIGRGKGQLAIPRVLLRHLAGGATPARIAVALAALFRCLSCRGGLPDGRGRFKASWIATAFRVGRRQVVAARAGLVELGWLLPEGDNRQLAMNRWGRAYRINLCWKSPVKPIARPAPPRPAPAAPSAPPLLDRNPLREGEIQNQDLASGESAGVQLPGGKGRPKVPMIPNSSSAFPAPRPAATSGPLPATPGPVPAPGGLPRPRLEDVRVEDLKDTGRLMDLLGQASARGLVTGSEADRLRFVGASEHALAIGVENPAGLFVYLTRGKLWHYATQGDEDRAQGRIKAFLRGPETPAMASASASRPPARPMLSEDALVARRVRAALARVGYRGDPLPQVRRQDASWTRERWDAALAEPDGASGVGHLGLIDPPKALVIAHEDPGGEGPARHPAPTSDRGSRPRWEVQAGSSSFCRPIDPSLQG